MDNSIFEHALRECVGRGRDIVLVSNGINTAAVRELMRREYGLEPRFVVDSVKYDGVTVFPPDALPEGAEECTFLLTVTNIWSQLELKTALLSRVPENQIVMLADMDSQWEAIRSDPEKVRLDFLGVGFPKCLTTSLYKALRKNPNIYLADSKESFFLCQTMTHANHEQYKSMYRNSVGTDRLVGEIETKYGFLPQRVHAYFGDDIRLLFLLRDPTKALYSFFKMLMRLVVVNPNAILEFFEEFGRVCPEMYDKWVEKRWTEFQYGRSLRDYLNYYPREQIHVVLAEELIADTPGQMHELQRFIGLPEEKRIEYTVLPRANEGKTVNRDYLCALTTHKLNEMLPALSDKPALRGEYFNKLLPKLWEYTQVEYNEPPLPETTARLREYFRDDIRLLEELLGRSLRGLWY